MQKVDAEIRRIVDQQYQLARNLIEQHRDKVETMAKALLEWETLDSDQINDIMEGRAPRPPKPAQPPSPPRDTGPQPAPAATPTPQQTARRRLEKDEG
jgi:cell division protease FtsH